VGRRSDGSTYLLALVNKLLDPAQKLVIVPVQNWRALDEGQQPGHVSEEGNVEHVGANRLENVSLLALGQHVGRLVEGKILHHVKHKVGEPLRNIKCLSLAAVNGSEELVDGLGDAGIVPLNGYDKVLMQGPHGQNDES
jgi:hypothetical protein